MACFTCQAVIVSTEVYLVKRWSRLGFVVSIITFSLSHFSRISNDALCLGLSLWFGFFLVNLYALCSAFSAHTEDLSVPDKSLSAVFVS